MWLRTKVDVHNLSIIDLTALIIEQIVLSYLFMSPRGTRGLILSSLKGLAREEMKPVFLRPCCMGARILASFPEDYYWFKSFVFRLFI